MLRKFSVNWILEGGDHSCARSVRQSNWLHELENTPGDTALFHEIIEKRSQKVSEMALFVSNIRFKHSLVRGGDVKKLYRW